MSQCCLVSRSGRPRPQRVMHAFRKSVAAYGIIALCSYVAPQCTFAQSPAPVACREIVLELYVQGEDVEARATFEEFANSRSGVVVAVRNVNESHTNRARVTEIAKHYGLREGNPITPLAYGLNRVVIGFSTPEEFRRQLQRMLRLEVFVRDGCSRCARAHEFMDAYSRRCPGLEIIYREVSSDATAQTDLNRLLDKHRTRAASVPVFHLCNKLVVGFAGPENTGKRLDDVLVHWTRPCSYPKKRPPLSNSRESIRPLTNAAQWTSRVLLHWRLMTYMSRSESRNTQPAEESGTAAEEPGLPPFIPLLEEPSDDGALPIGEPPSATELNNADHPEDTAVKLPVFGEISVNRVGLPFFTLAMGLVDGFNPCAMWVLLLLLSVLVNLHDRWRILAVAGIFIVVSGLAYLAFMAAWLNVFAFIGYLRPVQIALGILAVAIGGVHVKDFFALHRGLSLSIPESAKPSIYAQTRKIVTAENLWGAMIAATVLAVGVNIVELLCTAGLPAIYTEVLSQQHMAPLQEYGYLMLYIAAYMFDDTLMVAVVVITLSKRKLQEQEGRWLKLISGVAILTLGVIMLIRPDWLF